jgi:uncharacterized membrane protein HdeD (DUF308 family)
MLRLLKRKWWLTLIQGLLFIFLSFYIFGNPVIVLHTVSVWISIAVLLSGAIGLVAWLMENEDERDTWSLIWSLVTAIAGIIMLANIFSMMRAVTIVFGGWMLLAGLAVSYSGLKARKKYSLGWGAVIAGLLAALGGLGMMLNMSSGAVGISSLLGISVLLTGIAIILLAMVKKAVLRLQKD